MSNIVKLTDALVEERKAADAVYFFGLKFQD